MNTNQQHAVRRALLIAGVTLVTATTFTPGLAITRGEPTPVNLRPVSAQSPTPPPPTDPHQANQAVSNECFGTTPKPGSTPARPLCDWDKVFAGTDAQAAAARQQQRQQFESLTDRLKSTPDR
jgi:hypothetical protein